MTLTNATSLDNQVDYSSTNGISFADQTLNSIFNVSPQNAVRDEDDDDDDDADVIDDDDLQDDDDKGSTTSGMGSSSFADRPTGRTTGRMTDHEPGSGQ